MAIIPEKGREQVQVENCKSLGSAEHYVAI